MLQQKKISNSIIQSNLSDLRSSSWSGASSNISVIHSQSFIIGCWSHIESTKYVACSWSWMNRNDFSLIFDRLIDLLHFRWRIERVDAWMQYFDYVFSMNLVVQLYEIIFDWEIHQQLVRFVDVNDKQVHRYFHNLYLQVFDH